MVRKKTKKKKSLLQVILLYLAALLLIICTVLFITSTGNNSPEDYYDNNLNNDDKPQLIPTSISTAETTPLPLQHNSALSLSSDDLYSRSAILISLNNGSVLMQKNSDDKIYPASLTKIMTAIVAINHLSDLQEEVELPASIFPDLYAADASMAGFQPEEHVRAIDLLYGALLPSGAECCISLADTIAGSERAFVAMMNEEAEDLGMKNTHFTNTTGLPDKDHYTTVKDLAVLLSYALQNDTFREIFTTRRHTTKPTDKNPDGITFYSTLFENLDDPEITGGKILGGKTGYTDEAGLCLASLALIGDDQYIMVSAGADGNHNTEQYNITDARTVYDSLGQELASR